MGKDSSRAELWGGPQGSLKNSGLPEDEESSCADMSGVPTLVTFWEVLDHFGGLGTFFPIHAGREGFRGLQNYEMR